MYENSLRVPLIILDPRHKEHRNISEEVLNIDIAPTILDLASVAIPEIYQGKRLKDYPIIEHVFPKREAILFEHLWKKEEIPSSEAVRTDKW